MERDRSFRWACPDDHGALADVMFDAVRNGKSRYTERQRAAWLPERRTGPQWSDRLNLQEIVLAEQDGQIVGFMSLAPGRLRRLRLHPPPGPAQRPVPAAADAHRR